MEQQLIGSRILGEIPARSYQARPLPFILRGGACADVSLWSDFNHGAMPAYGVDGGAVRGGLLKGIARRSVFVLERCRPPSCTLGSRKSTAGSPRSRTRTCVRS